MAGRGEGTGHHAAVPAQVWHGDGLRQIDSLRFEGEDSSKRKREAHGRCDDLLSAVGSK